MNEETKRKIGLANTGEKNGMWKGNDIGYLGIQYTNKKTRL